MGTWGPLFCLVLIIMAGATGCSAPQTSPASSSPTVPVTSGTVWPAQTGPSGELTLHVDELAPGSLLPDAYTCKGTGESPSVSWDGIPRRTKSIVLILEDPDAPSGTFTHWLVYNLSPVAGTLIPAQPKESVLANGARQGQSSAGSTGYYPPCPPLKSVHRYIFRLYALDTELTLSSAERASFDIAVSGHILTKAELVTTFSR